MASRFRYALNEFESRVKARDWRDTSDIRWLANWLDGRFEIPGTTWRFGLDGLLGLIPGVGDLLTTMLGGYIVYRAHELGAPKLLIARMLGNLAIDSIVGAVPIAGDIFDVAFKSHMRNVRLLLRWLETQADNTSIRPL